MLLDAVPDMTPPPPRAEPSGAARLRATNVGKTYVSRDWLGRAAETAALQQAFFDYINGVVPDRHGWLQPVGVQ